MAPVGSSQRRAVGQFTISAIVRQNGVASAGVSSGLIVHIGCDDGELTAALRAGDGYLVHGLDADAEQVAAALQILHDARRAMGKPLPREQRILRIGPRTMLQSPGRCLKATGRLLGGHIGRRT